MDPPDADDPAAAPHATIAAAAEQWSPFAAALFDAAPFSPAALPDIPRALPDLESGGDALSPLCCAAFDPLPPPPPPPSTPVCGAAAEDAERRSRAILEACLAYEPAGAGAAQPAAGTAAAPPCAAALAVDALLFDDTPACHEAPLAAAHPAVCPPYTGGALAAAASAGPAAASAAPPPPPDSDPGGPADAPQRQAHRRHHRPLAASSAGPLGPRADAAPAPAGRRIKKARSKARKWAADEQARFEYALETWGRDWEACARHVGTRDISLIRSHAQKHFIKLYKTGRALPPRVAESGAGYTLSGNALRDDSPSARSYLTGLPAPAAPPPPHPASPRLVTDAGPAPMTPPRRPPGGGKPL
jgi:hypothetical protein